MSILRVLLSAVPTVGLAFPPVLGNEVRDSTQPSVSANTSAIPQSTADGIRLTSPSVTMGMNFHTSICTHPTSAAVITPPTYITTATSSSVQDKPSNLPVPYQTIPPLLDTPWTEKVGKNPWPQHPRPQLFREKWKSLNGIWTYQPAPGGFDDLQTPPAGLLQQEVMVPSCIESGLSGALVTDVTHMWFQFTFTLPSDWDETSNILLHFEAVDYQATVFVNGVQVGSNTGGYFRFSIDVTEQASADKSNDLLVFVFDPTDQAPYYIPNGKQTRRPSHIFYTPCSGIWQSVWLESVPRNHVTALHLTADMHGQVTATVRSSLNQSSAVTIHVYGHANGPQTTFQGTSNQQFVFNVRSPNLWSPELPTLYNLSVTMGNDTVQSYTGFRTISSGLVDNVTRPMLNGEFVFMFGTLDQGYWPDGIYLPPTLEAMVFDLQYLKSLGMNMVRKHIKIEPDLFYQACDQLGLLVIQDMPCMRQDSSGVFPDPGQQAEWKRQIEVMVDEHKSYPSIVTWVIYNEGWGQITEPYHPEVGIIESVRELDPSRVIDATTGWHDHGAGDFSDNHHYAGPQCGTPFYSTLSSPYDPARIGFQGEFGGIGHRPSMSNLWPVQQAIDSIPETYEISSDVDTWNYRGHVLLAELRDQVTRYACSGAVWTQTVDVEGEVNGLMTYDRRLVRANETQWRQDILALYEAAQTRGGKKVT